MYLPSLQICANWHDFFDPESGISFYKVGVGSRRNLTDVAGLRKFHAHTYTGCVPLESNHTLQHTHVYYIVVWTYNRGHRQLNVSAVSDGGE
jgi:hypothetical protein